MSLGDNEAKYGVKQGSSVRHTVLRRIVNYAAKVFPKQFIGILEVGSYEGESALVWAHALDALTGRILAYPGGVTCVDTWKPYHSKEEIASGGVYPVMNMELENGNVFRRFRDNLTLAPQRIGMGHFQGTMEEYMVRFIEEKVQPFQIIYIDGDHRYPAARKDIMLAMEMLAENGILCGDDLEKQVLDSGSAPLAVEQHARRHGHLDYVNGYHPGVTLAVHEAFGEVWSEAGTWAVQKTVVPPGIPYWRRIEQGEI